MVSVTCGWYPNFLPWPTAVVLNWRLFGSSQPWKHLAISGAMFGLLQLGRAYWSLEDRAQECCQISCTVHNATKNYLASNVNSAKVEKPCPIESTWTDSCLLLLDFLFCVCVCTRACSVNSSDMLTYSHLRAFGGHHGVNVFHLVGVLVSIRQLTGHG